jgi:hypothetical protein
VEVRSLWVGLPVSCSGLRPLGGLKPEGHGVAAVVRFRCRPAAPSSPTTLVGRPVVPHACCGCNRRLVAHAFGQPARPRPGAPAVVPTPPHRLWAPQPMSGSRIMGPAVPMDARWPWRRLMGAKGAAPTRRHAAPTACCAGLPPIYGCQRPWPPLAPTVPTHGLPAPTVLGVGWIRMMPTGWGFGHGVPIIGTGNGRRAIGPGAHTWAMGAHSWARGAANPWARWCPLVGAGCPQSEWGKGTDAGLLRLPQWVHGQV